MYITIIDFNMMCKQQIIAEIVLILVSVIKSAAPQAAPTAGN
jgi:hypothetical protein